MSDTEPGGRAGDQVFLPGIGATVRDAYAFANCFFYRPNRITPVPSADDFVFYSDRPETESLRAFDWLVQKYCLHNPDNTLGFDFLHSLGVLDAESRVAACEWSTNGAGIGRANGLNDLLLFFRPVNGYKTFQAPATRMVRHRGRLADLANEIDGATRVANPAHIGARFEWIPESEMFSRGLDQIFKLKPAIEAATGDIALLKIEKLGWTDVALESFWRANVFYSHNPKRLWNSLVPPLRDALKVMARRGMQYDGYTFTLPKVT